MVKMRYLASMKTLKTGKCKAYFDKSLLKMFQRMSEVLFLF